MQTLIKLFISISLLFLIASCGSSGEFSEVSDPLKPLQMQANDIVEQGGLAAVGEGISTRRDLAKRKAQTSAAAAMARVFERKIETMSKNFQEEVGQGQKSEVNELFQDVSKSVSKKEIRGARTQDYKMLSNDEGEYLYGVLMVVTPKTVNNSIMDEMQNQNKQLYQRFRASEAFKELQKEMENFED